MSLVNFIDIEFLSRISGHFKGFRQYQPNKWNLCCPFCREEKRKAYIFPDKHTNEMSFKCFKCGLSMSFSSMLSQIDDNIYRLYRRQLFSSKGFSLSGPPIKDLIEPKLESKIVVLRPENFFVPLASLEESHTARRYIESRCIPTDQYHRIWYTDSFWSVVKQLKPEQKVRDGYDEPRIILPIMDPTNKYMVGLQGRSLDPNAKLRYVDCQILKEQYLFGQEYIDESQPLILCEGPIDSLFLVNSCGICGFSKKLDSLPVNRIYYLDQEPRNRHVMERFEQLIEHGESVVMLPSQYIEMDVNDIAKSSKMNRVELTNYVLSHVYCGLKAKLKLAEWSKLTPRRVNERRS